MSKFDNKAIIRRYIEEIENTGDVSNIRAFISEDHVEVYESERYQIAIKGAIEHVLGVRAVNLLDPIMKAGVIIKKK
jgi:hypothetical protein